MPPRSGVASVALRGVAGKPRAPAGAAALGVAPDLGVTTPADVCESRGTDTGAVALPVGGDTEGGALTDGSLTGAVVFVAGFVAVESGACEGAFDVDVFCGALSGVLTGGGAITGGTLIGTGATFTGGVAFMTGTEGALTVGTATVTEGTLTEGVTLSALLEAGMASTTRIGADTAICAMIGRRCMPNS